MASRWGVAGDVVIWDSVNRVVVARRGMGSDRPVLLEACLLLACSRRMRQMRGGGLRASGLCHLGSDICRLWPAEGEAAEIKRLEGHLVDALALRGDEGRGTLR